MVENIDEDWQLVPGKICLDHPPEAATDDLTTGSLANSEQIPDSDTLSPPFKPQETTTGSLQVTDGCFKGHGNHDDDTLRKLLHRRYFHNVEYRRCETCANIIKIMQPWLCDRNEHRLWQKSQGIPSDRTPINKFTAHHQLLNACPCHLPDCCNVIFAEFDVCHLLATEDKRQYQRTGKAQPLWLPLVGPKLTPRRLAKLEKDHRGKYMTAVWGRFYDFSNKSEWTWASIKTMAKDYYPKIKDVRDMKKLLELFEKEPEPSQEEQHRRRLSQRNNTVLWKINPGWALLPPLMNGGDICLTAPWERCAIEWDSKTMRLWKQWGMWCLVLFRVVIWTLTGGWLWQRWVRDPRLQQLMDEKDI
ncbi:hypothetical protein V8F20_012362, partial [Naviculisporaceae sp. PSN 640]